MCLNMSGHMCVSICKHVHCYGSGMLWDGKVFLGNGIGMVWDRRAMVWDGWGMVWDGMGWYGMVWVGWYGMGWEVTTIEAIGSKKRIL